MRLKTSGVSANEYMISIHAPIVGCDYMQYLSKEDIYKFQSTHPSWGATRAYKATFSRLFISIHAPIVGCDIVNSRTAV